MRARAELPVAMLLAVLFLAVLSACGGGADDGDGEGGTGPAGPPSFAGAYRDTRVSDVLICDAEFAVLAQPFVQSIEDAGTWRIEHDRSAGMITLQTPGRAWSGPLIVDPPENGEQAHFFFHPEEVDVGNDLLARWLVELTSNGIDGQLVVRPNMRVTPFNQCFYDVSATRR